jgi:predicted metal-dependent phosphoesterase TrpH
MRKADLHVHTNASDDATLEPEWAFRHARELGLVALAFADHEGVANVEEGKRLSKVYGVAFLPGIEISSSWRGQLAHVLGYFPDGAASSLDTFLAERVWQERKRIQLMLLERLRQRGVAVTVAEYEAEAQAGRARTYHIPLYRLLLRKGILSSVKDYGAMRKAENVKYQYPPMSEVISVVHQAGGMVVLAHPGAQGGDFYSLSPLARRDPDG